MHPLMSPPIRMPSANASVSVEIDMMKTVMVAAAAMVKVSRTDRVAQRLANTPKSTEPTVPPRVSIMPAVALWSFVRPAVSSSDGVHELTK